MYNGYCDFLISKWLFLYRGLEKIRDAFSGLNSQYTRAGAGTVITTSSMTVRVHGAERYQQSLHDHTFK